jgi:hypothetical protein
LTVPIAIAMMKDVSKANRHNTQHHYTD